MSTEKTNFTTSVNTEILKEFKKIAIDEDITVSALIERLMKEYLEKKTKKK